MHIDLAKTLEGFTSRRYTHLKGIQLCANLLVRAVIVTDLDFDDPATHPREMRLFVPNGETWAGRYQLVRFPPLDPDAPLPSGSGAVGESQRPAPRSRNSTLLPPSAGGVGDERGGVTMITLPPPPPAADPLLVADAAALPHTYSVVRHATAATAGSAPREVTAAGVSVTPASTLPAVGLDLPHLNPLTDQAATVRGIHRAKTGVLDDDDDGRALEHGSSGRAVDGNSSGAGAGASNTTLLQTHVATLGGAEPDSRVLSALRDNSPILTLAATIGFSSMAPGGVAWAAEPRCVVYACHRVIVLLDTETRRQRLLLGHTAAVEVMAVDGVGG